MKRFRCGVFSVVKHDYIPYAVAAHPRFELVVVADDPAVPDWAHARNQLLADDFAIPYIRNLDEAIRDFDLDVAVVSSEVERHAGLSLRAARAGLHVVQDKPMSTRLQECDELVAAVEQHGVKFLMWNRNKLPAIEQARDTIRGGAIGRLQAVHVDFYFAKDAGPPLTEADRQDSAGRPPIDWLTHQIAAHADGSDGGVGTKPMGELGIEGIYPLGYIRAICDAPVENVYARATAHFHQLYADNRVEDLATVTLHLQGGIVGTICLGRIGAASHPDIGEIKLHLIGSEGAMVIAEPRPEVGVYYRDQAAKEFRNRRVANENDFLLMEDMARAIDEDRPTLLDAKAGRDIAAVVEAALESARSGRVVAVG